MTTITLARLKELGACGGQRDKFQELFGESVRVTIKLCTVHAQDFDWDWAAENLLTAPALAEYDRATAPAPAEYDRARVAAWSEFEKAAAAARAEYEKVRAAAWAEYDKATAVARAEYDRVRAAAFARAYRQQEAA